ncbi:MAG: helix-turn-helix domain-containing protein [Ruminococcus sp.]|nr:helix-turn-helix domain-containing protein [Ruminococcus sp.]
MRFKRNDENYVYGFVGKNIKKYRKMRGLTQDQLADIVNYSPSFIANIESSTHQTFSLGALWRIATALGVGLHEICYDNNKLGSANMNSVEYICHNCGNKLDMPIEVIDVFEFIYAVGKSKELFPTFTCPKCNGKLIPSNTDQYAKN